MALEVNTQLKISGYQRQMGAVTCQMVTIPSSTGFGVKCSIVNRYWTFKNCASFEIEIFTKKCPKMRAYMALEVNTQLKISGYQRQMGAVTCQMVTIPSSTGFGVKCSIVNRYWTFKNCASFSLTGEV